MDTSNDIEPEPYKAAFWHCAAMEPCPCGGRTYDECCGPILGGAAAATAVALMRSRYTAFTRADVDYLLRSHDAVTRASVNARAVGRWARTSRWLGLEIVAASADVVEFKARYRDHLGIEHVHHERSRFRISDGVWVYVDGDTP